MDIRHWLTQAEEIPDPGFFIAKTIDDYMLDAKERTKRALESGVASAQGHILLRQGEHKGASKVFNRCLREDPDCYPSLSGKYMIALKEGNYAEAADFLERQLLIKPDVRVDKYELFADVLMQDGVLFDAARLDLLEEGQFQHRTRRLLELCLRVINKDL